jgi:tRNA modification GTPase
VARLGELLLPGLRWPLQAMLIEWRTTRSFTGQTVAELHTTGSPPLLDRVLAACVERGARLAFPGEFTLRAFLLGRIDLTQAEAVLGVIEAGSDAQLRAAIDQLAGGLSGTIRALRDRVLDVLAHLEAGLDFVDERDVDPLARRELVAAVEAARERVEALSGQLSGRNRADGHPRVVLLGPPNAGKSRLFNALVGKPEALVAPVAGTTRDYLVGVMDLGEMTVELVDTAGIESPLTETRILRAAGRLRDRERESADLSLFCRSIDTADAEAPIQRGEGLHVWTKSDLAPAHAPGHENDRMHGEYQNDWITCSAVTGDGLDVLRRKIQESLQGEEACVSSTRARCRESLIRAAESLQRASSALAAGESDELVAIDLRAVLTDLGSVVGEVVTDDLLDRIFSRFCIGK